MPDRNKLIRSFNKQTVISNHSASNLNYRLGFKTTVVITLYLVIINLVYTITGITAIDRFIEMLFGYYKCMV